MSELAQELKTHLNGRKMGYMFESNRHTKFSPRRIQQIVKQTATNASITKKVHPYLLRHTVAAFLLEKGMLSIVQSKKNINAGYWNYAKNVSYNTAYGAMKSMQLGNGKWESTVSNTRLQPTQIALGTVQNGTDKLKLNFEYNSSGQNDNNGNVSKQTITVPTVGTNNGFTAVQTYTYDELNRLKSATENIDGNTTASWKQTFTYDRYGNRNFDEDNTTTLTKLCGTALNFSVCPNDRKAENPSISPINNRIIEDQDNDQVDDYKFDLAGNTTKDVGNNRFTYDGENKQIKVETIDANGNVTGIVGEYWYDGDGKRVKKKVGNDITSFVYNASGQLIADYATQISQTPKVSYLTSDHLGSPRITTDKDGDIYTRRDFMPFGEEIDSSHTSQRSVGLNYATDEIRQKFTTYERDNETDLDFAQARMHNYNLGRFTSSDPYNIILEVKSEKDKNKAIAKLEAYLLIPSKWNRYHYSLNNPLSFVDPDGEDVVVAFTGGIVGGAKTVDDKDDTTVKLVNAAKKEAKKRNIEFDGVAIAPNLNVNSAVDVAYKFIKKNYKKGEALIIYGYSNGGDAAVELTDKLKKDGIKVDLLITVDSSDGPLRNTTVNNVIPDNVEFNRNLYQTTSSGPSNSSGSSSSFPGSKGGPNTASNSSKTTVRNYNVTKSGITHANIDEKYLDSNSKTVKNFMSAARR